MVPLMNPKIDKTWSNMRRLGIVDGVDGNFRRMGPQVGPSDRNGRRSGEGRRRAMNQPKCQSEIDTQCINES